jgi:ABC-type oligopeptide transport system substrate-binding subunit
MKRFAALFAVLALCLALAAPAAAEKSIVIGLASDALFMDPSQQDETITNTMGRYMYDGLLTTTPSAFPGRPRRILDHRRRQPHLDLQPEKGRDIP